MRGGLLEQLETFPINFFPEKNYYICKPQKTSDILKQKANLPSPEKKNFLSESKILRLYVMFNFLVLQNLHKPHNLHNSYELYK